MSTCGFTWSTTGVDHYCFLEPGHPGDHWCRCDARRATGAKTTVGFGLVPSGRHAHGGGDYIITRDGARVGTLCFTTNVADRWRASVVFNGDENARVFYTDDEEGAKRFALEEARTRFADAEDAR